MKRLTIELVPQTSWYTNVRSNVSSDVWDRIRRKSYRSADYQCEICGGIGPTHPVECHEIWDYDDDTHEQKLVGFISLCPACHQVKHIGLASIRGKLHEAVEHLKMVNDIDDIEAGKLVASAFDQWEERSLHLWNVDISYIENYLS